MLLFSDCHTVIAPNKTPYERFLDLIPEGCIIDPETSSIIVRYYGNWLVNIHSVEHALELLDSALQHIHQSTAHRLQEIENVHLINVIHLKCWMFHLNNVIRMEPI